MARYSTCGDIINRVAVEVGQPPATDPFASADPSFRQLGYLLTTVVQELMQQFPWQILTREFQTTTTQGQSGDIPLPDDFGYMIDQTGWERNENVPLIGPLSPQDWTYLLGRDLVGTTIYASFRFDQGVFRVFPNDPVPAGLDLNFEYISRNLIQVAGSNPVEYTDEATASADIVQLDTLLTKNLLKAKYLEARGLPSDAARNEYAQALEAWMGKDNSGKMLNAGSFGRAYPYLNSYRNTPDTKFGVF